MSERTRDGIEAALERARAGGRKPKLAPAGEAVRSVYDETGEDRKRRDTVQQIADELRVTRPTVYRALGDRMEPAAAR